MQLSPSILAKRVGAWKSNYVKANSTVSVIYPLFSSDYGQSPQAHIQKNFGAAGF
jgi:hypothetical protein